jgi:hypothetical protein
MQPNLPASSTSATPLAHFAFGQVRHKRLRPAVHAFSYGAWFVRLPMRALAKQQGNTGVPGLSVGQAGQPGRFAVLDKDHGDGQQPLLAWAEQVLAEAQIQDAGGEIWLHTFARVLGYVFNPVSFWFCHRADNALRAVICEVNNTFGERHCYLLANADGSPLKNGQELRAQKVFHVSPFCKIEGNYRFRFMFGDGQMVARIDHDDASGPLLLTSISGKFAPLTANNVRRAFWLYPWMSFGVMVRIHWQAFKLWRKRVPFISKPAPPKDFITTNH